MYWKGYKQLYVKKIFGERIQVTLKISMDENLSYLTKVFCFFILPILTITSLKLIEMPMCNDKYMLKIMTAIYKQTPLSGYQMILMVKIHNYVERRIHVKMLQFRVQNTDGMAFHSLEYKEEEFLEDIVEAKSGSMSMSSRVK